MGGIRVSADSDVHLVNAMASRIRKENIDTLIALGGGSVMVVKAVAVVVKKAAALGTTWGSNESVSP